MTLEIILAVLAGILVGIFTGVTPGIHINLVAAIVVSSAAFLSQHLSLVALAVFIISVGITHTFLDTLPSIYLGAPNEDTALGVLPGHRFLLKGKAYDAVRLSVIGAHFGLLASFVLFYPFMLLISWGYPYLSKYMVWILLLVVAYMILRDRTKYFALLVFLLSGALGIIVFSLEVLNDPLLPLLSGLFGVSTLLLSLNDANALPEQRITKNMDMHAGKTLKAVGAGNLSALFTSTLPGLSSSIAATISVQTVRKLHDDGFLILLGAIGTAGFSLSLVAILAVDKARNGAIIAIQEITGTITAHHVLVFLAASLIAGSVALVLTLVLARGFSRFITRISYKHLVAGIIIFVTLLVIVMTGWVGFLVLIVSTCIGILPGIVKCTRTQSMGCLMVPVILYFLG
jgi:putative membrane protein